jgi:hypothetical protein
MEWGVEERTRDDTGLVLGIIAVAVLEDVV